MVEAWLHVLLIQTLALTVAAFAARALQAVVVRRLGAASAYLCWLLVPVSMAAVALPHPSSDALAIRIDVAAMVPVWAVAARRPGPDSAAMLPTLALAAWIAGAALLAAVLALRQRRFAALAEVPAEGGPLRLPAGSGPAVIGLWRRRVVLPRDFDSTFDDEERRLMLLHEGVHLRRGDNLWNLLAAALLVLHWFNPIAWWAWRRMRFDQETSCDAAVLREAAPGVLAVYAGALLKVQGVVLAPPLATAWQSTHPLVERVRMLQVHRISSARHRAGARVAALAVGVAAFAGYALQAVASAPPATASAAVMTAVEVRVDAVTAMSARLLTQAGQAATLRLDPDAKNALKAPVEIDYAVTRLDGDRLRLDTSLREGSPLAAIGSPRIVTRDGEAASVSVKTADGTHELAVSFVPKVVAAVPAVPALPPTSALPLLPPVPATSALPPLPATSALPPLPATPALAARPPAPPAQRAL